MNAMLNFADFKREYTLPSPRGTGLAIMRLCQREEVALDELARVIVTDPVLTGQVIRFGNCINPNPQRRIASVSIELLILIGVSVVRQIAMGLSLVASYRSGSCTRFDYEHFWLRSLGMACAAQSIGQRIRIAPPAEMFASGLLANIGSLGLATARPTLYGELLDAVGDAPAGELLARETALLGIHHNALSAAMMEDWRMPGLFCDAVEFHEQPERAPFDAGTRQQRLTLAFGLAADIADYCLAMGKGADPSRARIDSRAAELGLDAQDVLAHAIDDWRQWTGFLGLDEKRLPPALPLLSAA